MLPVTYEPQSAGAELFPADPLDTWFVLRTKSRQEKILANELRSRGIDNFLPIVTCTKYYGGRKATVSFNASVFCVASRSAVTSRSVPIIFATRP